MVDIQVIYQSSCAIYTFLSSNLLAYNGHQVIDILCYLIMFVAISVICWIGVALSVLALNPLELVGMQEAVNNLFGW